MVSASLSVFSFLLIIIIVSLYPAGFSFLVDFSSAASIRRDGKGKRRVAVESSSSNKASELWCVAKNNAEDGALQSGLDWVCGPGGANCGPIQQGGPCFEPNNIQSHASYAFNDYFLKNGLNPQSCDFGNAAALIALNPSHGKCVFQSSMLARNGSFTGSATATGIGPSGADISGSYMAYGCGRSSIAALLMFTAALILQ